jgi:hypothetical protein
MYSIIPLKPHERHWFRYWAYDTGYMGMQFFFWIIYWVEDGSINVHIWAMIMPIFGVLMIIKDGLAAMKRAIFIGIGMEVALWTAYLIAIRFKAGQLSGHSWPVIVLLVYMVMILVVSRHGLTRFDSIEALRHPRDH